MEKSAHLRAHAAFAGRLELLPLADERVKSYQVTPDNRVAVSYESKRATRVLLVGKVAGEWTLLQKVIIPAKVVEPPAPAKFDHKPFHFTEWKSTRATYPERKVGHKKHRRVSVVKIRVKGRWAK